MLTSETGPYGVFAKLRDTKLFTNVFACFYCTSVWVAGGVTLLFSRDILHWLALSSIAIFINIIHEKVA